MSDKLPTVGESCKAEIYLALCHAAIARQGAFNESCDTYKAHSENKSLPDSYREQALTLSSIFLSMAKAARIEAEAMRDAFYKARDAQK